MLSVVDHFIELKHPFRVAFGTLNGLDVVRVELSRDGATGWGECCPMGIYDHDVASVMEQITSMAAPIAAGEIDRMALQEAMPAGPARNALDCALWDWEAKHSGKTVWELAGLECPATIAGGVSIGIKTPEETAATLNEFSNSPCIKLKLGGEHDMDNVRIARETLPDTPIFVDVNGGWTLEQLNANAPILEQNNVFMIEQPLAMGQDKDVSLDEYSGTVPLCADESCHDRSDLERLAGRYGYVNMKLDKTGGLTEALKLASSARDNGFKLMVGCMMGSGLAMAPAYVLAAQCDVVDLDLPLILKDSAVAGIHHDGERLHAFKPELWG